MSTSSRRLVRFFDSPIRVQRQDSGRVWPETKAHLPTRRRRGQVTTSRAWPYFRHESAI
jgi:hypothetical protein